MPKFVFNREPKPEAIQRDPPLDNHFLILDAGMKTLQRYLVAKYAPDVRRMEPHNIGVILWTPKVCGAKFITPKKARFIRDKETYERWVDFWNLTIKKEEIETRHGPSVKRSDPGFVDALIATARGNYLLYESGFVQDRLSPSQVPQAAAYLFHELVSDEFDKDSPERSISEHDTLSMVSKRLLADAGISDRPDFKKQESVKCRVGKVTRAFTVNFARTDKRHKALALFHRVSLFDEKSIDSASFMYEQIVKNKLIPKSRCGAIVQSEGDREIVGGAIEQLEQFSTVLDVSNYSKATSVAQSVAFGSGA